MFSDLIALKFRHHAPALVAVMLALALWHRLRTTRRFETDGMAPYFATLAAEACLGLIVLSLAIWFRLALRQPPPAVPLPITHLQQGSLMTMVQPSAAALGLVGLDLSVLDPSRPTQPKEITVSLSDSIAGIGPIKTKAVRMEHDTWHIPAVTLPTKRPWKLTVSVLLSDFEIVKVQGVIGMPD